MNEEEKKGDELKYGEKKVRSKSGDYEEEEEEKEEMEEEDSVAIPLLCKIRICEDGVDAYVATEDFCRGTVSYRTVRYGLLHIYFLWDIVIRCEENDMN